MHLLDINHLLLLLQVLLLLFDCYFPWGDSLVLLGYISGTLFVIYAIECGVLFYFNPVVF